MAARVSVVVPVYNVAAYLEPCLESLADQTASDLEVVMVDDGSTDESPEIASRFAARDSRFRLVRQENAGLGAARNTGAAHASGEFLAFVDSDDVVPRHAYELLLGALDKTGSDFAYGNAMRLTPFGLTAAGFLAGACKRTRLRTHITRFPLLIVDRTAWNKLFRRSFWDQHGFRFPEGVYYEDIPVTLPAHYLARSVDVVEQTVYLWRMREGDDLSITQRRTEPKALRDRVAAVESVSRFLAEQRLPISKAIYDRSVLTADLHYFLEVLPGADEPYRRLFLELANEFLDRADSWALEQRFAIDRLKWQLVRRRALPELLEVLRFEEEELEGTPPVRLGRHWYGDYPYRSDARLAIPAKTFRLGSELAPVWRLNEVRWEGDSLHVEGFAFVNQIGAPAPGSQSVELVARRRSSWRRRVSFPTEQVRRPDVTAAAAQQVAPLDWTGFRGRLDPEKLTRRGRWQEGSWELAAVIRADGAVRTSRRPEPASLQSLPGAERWLPDGTRLWAGLGSDGRLTVEVRRHRAVVASAELDDGVLVLQGEVDGATGGRPRLRASRRIGGARLEYPLYVDRSRRPAAFLARLPVDDLVHELDAGEEAAPAERVGDAGEWELLLVGGGSPRMLTLDEQAAEPTWSHGGRELALRRTSDGGLSVSERPFRPVVTAAEWSRVGALVLSGSFRGPAGDYELVLAGQTGETAGVPLDYDADAGRFRAELTPAAVTLAAGTRPLAEGVWRLGLRRPGAHAEREVPVGCDGTLRERLPLSTEVGLKRFHLALDGDDAALVAERDLAEDERGGVTQRRLRSSFYPRQRTGKLRDAVVYDSFGGREYSDSPRALHEELVRREAPLEHLWVVRDAAFGVPEPAVAVRYGSREHYEAMARARYVVANDHWPRWFRRRQDQVCLQTWHGFPLKRLGLSLADRPKALRAYRRALGQKPENWQYLVSPAPAATPILERAFPVGSEVLETGLPRTDLVRGPDGARVAEDVKRRLGIEGRRVVLYAPTYRDHLQYRPGRRPGQLRDLPSYSEAAVRREGYRLGPLLDLSALRSALDDDAVVLFHRHRRIVDSLPANGAVVDVSGFPDPGELLLAADALVTDYSSALVDFACTGKPIVLFTPDLEDYRDEIRGFSVDFEADAPAPLLRTTEEVAEALRDLGAYAAENRARHDRFVAAYCSLSDGNASGRVVDRVFSW
jgi:CDP-glycerol glycerophosphotransferase